MTTHLGFSQIVGLRPGSMISAHLQLKLEAIQKAAIPGSLVHNDYYKN
jgi:hypothetical protein